MKAVKSPKKGKAVKSPKHGKAVKGKGGVKELGKLASTDRHSLVAEVPCQEYVSVSE